jgi:uncharacterized membrane protein
MSVLRNLREEATGVVALVVLGLGLLAMFAPGLSPVPFYVIWIVGFAVVLPLVAITLGETESVADPFESGDPFDRERRADEATAETGTSDPLAELRRRYAEGEIDEHEFERRVERLLETEDERAATEYLERRRADDTDERDGVEDRDAGRESA